MNKRLRKAQRVVAVQSLLEQLADWRLRELTTQERLLETQRCELASFLDRESAFSGLFASTAMRRIQGLEDLRAALIDEKCAQAGFWREQHGRLRSAERTAAALQVEARRKQEANELAEAIQRAVDCRE